jgi:hypothetical protein
METGKTYAFYQVEGYSAVQTLAKTCVNDGEAKRQLARKQGNHLKDD